MPPSQQCATQVTALAVAVQARRGGGSGGVQPPPLPPTGPAVMEGKGLKKIFLAKTDWGQTRQRTFLISQRPRRKFGPITQGGGG